MFRFLKNLFAGDQSSTGPRTGSLPKFTYFPDPIKVGAITKDPGVCDCCGRHSDWNCPKGIYSRHTVDRLCPWCVADGSAAKKFKGSFQDLHDVPQSVPKSVKYEVNSCTPGFETWQGNTWLFSEKDAMIFVGEVNGKELLAKNNRAQIQACMSMDHSPFENEGELSDIVPAGSPAVYMFQDRKSGEYHAYWDCD